MKDCKHFSISLIIMNYMRGPKNTRNGFSAFHQSVSPIVQQDYVFPQSAPPTCEDYRRCVSSCFARSGYDDDLLAQCEIECGGPRDC